jgi:hypothetical protein
MATTVPTQYPVDKKIKTPLRTPFIVAEQSAHLQKLAVYEDALMSWNAKGHIDTPTPIAMDIARMNLQDDKCGQYQLHEGKMDRQRTLLT